MRPPRRMLACLAPLIAAAICFLLMPSRSPRHAHTEYWRSGDIVLLNGKSFRSRAVRLLEGYSSDYSHVGIVVMQHGTVFVVHADPVADKVIQQPWSEMIAGGEYSGGALYRLRKHNADATASACASAVRWAQQAVPFDHQFDLHTAERLYCTELVWRAYEAAGVNLVKGTGATHRYLLPAHLIQSPRLYRVLRF